MHISVLRSAVQCNGGNSCTVQVPVTVGEEEGLTLILDLHTNLATFGRYNLEDCWDIIRI